MIKRVLFISLLVIFSNLLFSEENKPVWEKISNKEIAKIEKNKSFKNIIHSIQKDYKFGKLKEVSYFSCEEEFPELPNQFPCSFLTSEFLEEGNEIRSQDNVQGGVIQIKSSINNSISGGKVVVMGEEDEEDKNEDALKIFYLKNNYISHYQHKNFLVVFFWKGKKGEETLVEIIKMELNRKYNIKNAFRVKF